MDGCKCGIRGWRKMDGCQLEIPDALFPSANKLRSERHFPVLSASCLPPPRWIRATNPLFQVWRLLHITCYPIWPIQGQTHVGMRGTGRSEPVRPIKAVPSFEFSPQPIAKGGPNLQRKGGRETMYVHIVRWPGVGWHKQIDPMLQCKNFFHAFRPVCNANPHEPRLPDGFGKRNFPRFGGIPERIHNGTLLQGLQPRAGVTTHELSQENETA